MRRVSCRTWGEITSQSTRAADQALPDIKVNWPPPGDCKRPSVTPSQQEQLMSVVVIKANLLNAEHQRAIVAMMDAYSQDPMGDGKPLSDYAREHLVAGLIAHPTTIVFLVFENMSPCGIATCFRGFSTFAAKPLINVSDFYIEPRLRGYGIGTKLLMAIEHEAMTTGCCRLTLEVQQNNSVARAVYGNFGFRQAVYAADANGGGSLYMVKQLH